MILFVCTGNTCRSPMAMALAGRYGLCAQSAGLSGGGSKASPNAIAVMAEMGLDLSGHLSRRVTDQLVYQADEIVCLTASHAAALCAAYPQAALKTRFFVPDVPDPYGGSPEDYRRAARAIDAWIQANLLRNH